MKRVSTTRIRISGGGVDELQTQGAEPQQSKQMASHYLYGKADKIAGPGFSAAFKKVWHLKKVHRCVVVDSATAVLCVEREATIKKKACTSDR